jgi:hypothetical protein
VRSSRAPVAMTEESSMGDREGKSALEASAAAGRCHKSGRRVVLVGD